MDSWAVRSIPSVRTSNTLAELQGAITRAEDAGGGWVPLVFHRVSDEGVGGGYTIDPKTFAAFAEWLGTRSSRGTHVRPVHEVAGGA
jgi:hypothetical protein